MVAFIGHSFLSVIGTIENFFFFLLLKFIVPETLFSGYSWRKWKMTLVFCQITNKRFSFISWWWDLVWLSIWFDSISQSDYNFFQELDAICFAVRCNHAKWIAESLIINLLSLFAVFQVWKISILWRTFRFYLGGGKKQIAIHTNVANWKNLENIKILQAVKICYIWKGFYIQFPNIGNYFPSNCIFLLEFLKNNFKFK